MELDYAVFIGVCARLATAVGSFHGGPNTDGTSPCVRSDCIVDVDALPVSCCPMVLSTSCCRPIRDVFVRHYL